MQQLTRDTSSDLDPFWSPDGDEIVFTSSRSGNYGLWIMSLVNKSKHQITPPHFSGSCYFPSRLTFGNRIVFSYGIDENIHIYIMDVIQKNAECITCRDIHNPIFGPIYFKRPTPSLDSQKLLFYSNRSDGNSNIWMLTLNNQKYVRITDHIARDFDPDWTSSNDNNVVFVSDRSGTNELYLVNTNNLDKTIQLTLNTANESTPRWSPSGDYIAYSSDESGTENIWVIDIFSKASKQLTNHIRANSPTWSPDGSRIAFSSKESGNYDIWVLHFNERIVFPEKYTTSIRNKEKRTSHESEGIRRVAVLEFFTAASVSNQDAGRTVAEWISISINRIGQYKLYERILLKKILEEQDLWLFGLMDEETVEQIGKLYGVQAIVTGTVTKLGDHYTIIVKMIDINTAEIMGVAELHTPGLNSIHANMDGLAKELCRSATQ